MKNKILISLILLISIFGLSACSEQQKPAVKEANLESQTTSWKLIQGTPPHADPTPIIYEGQVELSGWIEEKTFYGNEKLPHFHIADQTLIPSHIKSQDFLLTNSDGQLLDEETLAHIKTKSEKAPVTILVDQLKINMEGSPALRFIKIVD